ncbi:PadR family transcriptional regulator [Ruania alba]|uniref:DNA-binding transcriptional regulator, PadR family n=1 Tax=Ruania alba TaxID=648782 RepID=A0A1H5EKP6_9MICO|nr:PadR family transcriptional regulator [Ruania alba]SED91655.1 DNA-binding transcriptional regulator, PadR family [Ruania alba]
MKLEIALLSWLLVRRMSGYDIVAWLKQEGKFIGYDRYASQVYRYLNRLHEAGLLEFEVEKRQNAPDAKVYHITDSGVQRLREWLASTYAPKGYLDDPELKFRIEVGALLDLPRALELIDQELAFRTEEIARNRGRDRSIDTTFARPEANIAALEALREEQHVHGNWRTDRYMEWMVRLRSMLDDLSDRTIAPRRE